MMDLYHKYIRGNIGDIQPLSYHEWILMAMVIGKVMIKALFSVLFPLRSDKATSTKNG
jgi:hypothetical protein